VLFFDLAQLQLAHRSSLFAITRSLMQRFKSDLLAQAGARSKIKEPDFSIEALLFLAGLSEQRLAELA
jgi:hypothetical protein